MAKPPEKPRRPSLEDEALFRQAMREARPLPARPTRARTAAPPPAIAMPHPRLVAAAPTPLPPAPEPPPKVVVERRAMVPGLDRRSAARLAKGALVIEARLDLHGLRQADAHEALRRFILDAVSRELRCVLIVTGKGQAERRATPMGEEAPGVLKRNLPRWLGQPPLADKVLALRQAMPQHGGEGAYYVLLRRRRR